ncbi:MULTISPECIES: hypothetical protein [unclassified Bradyrhizobium]|uniref:hypothetical protein n=1 Tax=unclassified Bradyrhizobium TaxID=2631580 RepID=UPI0028E82A87|nr:MULTISPECIES: hypothetical protein [unclassified Bradyrhizobium]
MKVITIGKRLVAAEQIVLVEAFDAGTNPESKPEKEFKARIVLLNRDTVLAEETPEQFASAHDLHLLAEDNVAINRAITFRVETFAPTESFKPTKPYQARLKWRDIDGGDQSKLLLTAPEALVAQIVNGAIETRSWRQNARRAVPDVVGKDRRAWRRFRASS